MMNTHDELRHVKEGSKPDEKIYGAGTVRFLATSRTSAPDAMSNAKEVMAACLSVPEDAFDDPGLLSHALPPLFVGRFRAEATREQDDAFLAKWRAANDEQKQQLEQGRGWSLSEWAHWMKPENREWWWWDAAIVSNQYCAVAVAVDGWPFPWEALKVLLINSGFNDVQAEKD